MLLPKGIDEFSPTVNQEFGGTFITTAFCGVWFDCLHDGFLFIVSLPDSAPKNAASWQWQIFPRVAMPKLSAFLWEASLIHGIRLQKGSRLPHEKMPYSAAQMKLI